MSVSSRRSTPSGSESAVANAKRQRLMAKLIEKVLQFYQEMGGPRLGITGRALLSAQVEAAIMLGNLKSANLKMIAHKVKEAQSAENAEMGRPSTSTSSKQGLTKDGPRRLSTPLIRPSAARPPTSSSRPSTSGGVRLPPAVPTAPAPRPVEPAAAEQYAYFLWFLLPILSFGLFFYRTTSAPNDITEERLAEEKGSREDHDIPELKPDEDNKNQLANDSNGEISFWDQRLQLLTPDDMPSGAILLSPLERKRNEKLSNSDWDHKLNQEIREYQKQLLDTRKARNEFQQFTKNTLDEQCKQNEMLRQQERDADNRFFNSEVEKRRKWDAQNLEDEKLRRNLKRQERESLKNQMDTREEIRKGEENIRKTEEKDYASLIAKEYLHAKMEEAKKKDKMKQDFLAFLKFNNEQSDLKRIQKVKDMEEDKRFLQEYTEYLDAQETAYQEGLKRIAEKQQKIQVTAQSGYFKDIWEIQRQDAERAARIQREHLAQQMEDERQRKLRVKQRNDDMKKVLDEQMAEKERIKQEEIADALRRRRKLDEDVASAQESHRQEVISDQMARMERSKDLQKQVFENIIKARKPPKVKIMGIS